MCNLDFLVEEFCAFITRISKYNYKIDLSKYIYSDVTSTFISHDDNLVEFLTSEFSGLTGKSEEPAKNNDKSIENVSKRISEQLCVYIPHLPKCNIIHLLSVIKSKHIYTFEDYILLITIHAICIALLPSFNNNDDDELSDIFNKLNVMDSATRYEGVPGTNIIVSICNICTFSVAAEMNNMLFHIHQIMDLLMMYMKAWKELDLPIKFIVPFEKLENNPLTLLASSDLIVNFIRLPFPLMRWQRQMLFEWKLGVNYNNYKLSKLVDSSNGLTVAEILNLPIMRGWDQEESDNEYGMLKSDYYFDFTNSKNVLNMPIESHVVTGVSGVGKTNYAINLAKKLQVPFVRFSVTEYLRPEIGLSEREINKFFKTLYKYSSGSVSCVLLMESLDSVSSYNVTSVVARELNNLLSNNYWNEVHKILVIVTITDNIDCLKYYHMIRNFKVIKLEPLNLDNTTEILTQMLNKTFSDCEQVIQIWKRKQNKNSVFTISQIRDIVESSKMKSLTRLLGYGGVSDKLTLLLEDLPN